MTERERVREQIEGIVEHWQGISREHPNPIDMHFCVEEILAIKVGNRTLKEWIELQDKGKLVIVADDQSLPPSFDVYSSQPMYIRAQEDMKEAGFVRVVK